MSAILSLADVLIPRIFSIIDQLVRDKDVADQLKAKMQSEMLNVDHEEQMAIYAQFAAEFGHAKNNFDSFVDGMNRLVRPLVTYGVIGLFVYAAANSDGFRASMTALQSVPNWLWALFATVIGFWFGGRALKDWGRFIVPAATATDPSLPPRKPIPPSRPVRYSYND